MTAIPRGARGAQYGFTLLELLVVMTLMSLLMVGMVSALRTMAQTETRIDQRLQRLDEWRSAYALLSGVLAHVATPEMDVPDAPGKRRIPWRMTPDTLTWVGEMPARPGVGGRTQFRLALESIPEAADPAPALVLRRAAWQPDAAAPDWDRAERTVLVHQVNALQFEAQGQRPRARNPNEPWPQGWQTDWPVPDVAPQHLRLTLHDAQTDQPRQWAFALRYGQQTDAVR
ncbi:MAG: hypothetical protein Fur007_04610 [Rhodoferax sp.]